ncbi:MAG TPA: DUF885 domain-containing protein [Luteitalea sp.]|nr:DUF885 domain-containing protein [Luteitalea sp.]
MQTRVLVVTMALAAWAGGCTREALAPAPGEGAPAATGSPAHAALTRLIDEEWDWRLRESPVFATSVGDHRFDERLSTETTADEQRRGRESQQFLDRLAGIDRATLTPRGLVDADMLRAQLEDRVASVRFREYLVPINADSGFHSGFALMPQSLRLADAKDYDNYIARLRAFPRYMDEHIARMREGLQAGITVPKVALTGADTSVLPLMPDDPTASPLYRPFKALPATLPAAERTRLEAAGRSAIVEAVTPAYARFKTFLAAEYIPGARESIAASALPDGTAYYEYLVKRFTTLPLTAEQVHQTGLAEVAKIRAEMEQVMRKTGFTGDFAAFLQMLRTDPRFYPKTGEQLLKEGAWIAKRMDAKLPSLFGRLPRQPYGVAPVPDYLAPKYTGGRYNGNPPDSTEPGYYWLNTYALNTRPLYNLEALTLHEAVPGHHLQIALANETTDIPKFRKYSYISAFGEGWGLYSEWLGIEAGFYTDPYSDFGRLTYAMWRAARLVVDTGMHVKGWTRQQSIDYLATNTALSLHECTTETDRYIAWPGQALSYKIGELKIRELRARAEQALGTKFDRRRFHDAVLANGSVPLPVLEQQIDTFIKGESAR